MLARSYPQSDSSISYWPLSQPVMVAKMPFAWVLKEHAAKIVWIAMAI